MFDFTGLGYAQQKHNALIFYQHVWALPKKKASKEP
jgi:hypothetical protein